MKSWPTIGFHRLGPVERHEKPGLEWRECWNACIPGVGPASQVVLFDFDGTISLISRGWMDVMVHDGGAPAGAEDGRARRVCARWSRISSAG